MRSECSPKNYHSPSPRALTHQTPQRLPPPRIPQPRQQQTHRLVRRHLRKPHPSHPRNRRTYTRQYPQQYAPLPTNFCYGLARGGKRHGKLESRRHGQACGDSGRHGRGSLGREQWRKSPKAKNQDGSRCVQFSEFYFSHPGPRVGLESQDTFAAAKGIFASQTDPLHKSDHHIEQATLTPNPAYRIPIPLRQSRQRKSGRQASRRHRRKHHQRQTSTAITRRRPRFDHRR